METKTLSMTELNERAARGELPWQKLKKVPHDVECPVCGYDKFALYDDVQGQDEMVAYRGSYVLTLRLKCLSIGCPGETKLTLNWNPGTGDSKDTIQKIAAERVGKSGRRVERSQSWQI